MITFCCSSFRFIFGSRIMKNKLRRYTFVQTNLLVGRFKAPAITYQFRQGVLRVHSLWCLFIFNAITFVQSNCLRSVRAYVREHVNE